MKRWLHALIWIVCAQSAWASDSLEKLAREFGNTLSSMKKPTVGVLPFPYHDGKVSGGSTILSERLTTYMADLKNIRLIERSLLKKVLEEQHLAESGVVETSAVRQVGKILDVDVIVSGTLNDLDDNHTELNARLLRSSNGEVLGAKRIVVNRVWTDAPHRPKPPYIPVVEEDVVAEPSKPVSNEPIEIGFPSGSSGVRSSVGRR